MNEGQQIIYNYLLNFIFLNKNELIFVNGHGDTRKTYQWQAILTKVRSNGKIALPMTTSRIAALLLLSGIIAHFRFCLPLDITSIYVLY